MSAMSVTTALMWLILVNWTATLTPGNACDICSNDPENDKDHDGVCGDVTIVRMPIIPIRPILMVMGWQWLR